MPFSNIYSRLHFLCIRSIRTLPIAAPGETVEVTVVMG